MIYLSFIKKPSLQQTVEALENFAVLLAHLSREIPQLSVLDPLSRVAAGFLELLLVTERVLHV